MDAPAIIDVRGLTKRYGNRTVVDHVNMQVERGRIHGFLEPNGSGTCLGFDLRTEAHKIKRHVGYMTQKFGLYEDLSIEENLDFIARVYEVPEHARKVQATLDRLGLASRRTQLAGALSGGWKQRLALAACLLHDPQLLLLDEPTAGVDPKARREFWDHLHELAAGGLTVLVSTHYMDEAERCHRLTYIAYGRLLAQGTAQELIAAAGLSTCAVTGPDLAQAARELRMQPTLNVASFGATLHVSATSADELDTALAPLRARGLPVTPVETSLEDVFIAQMQQAQDNFPA